MDVELEVKRELDQYINTKWIYIESFCVRHYAMSFTFTY